MLSGEKILVTGPAGQIAFPLTTALARDNEVWGMARFSDPATERRVKTIGVNVVRGDLADGVPDELPADFTYVLHLATFSEPTPDYDHALRVNAEATGLLLAHCRKAKAALVMSTHAVYKPNDDPLHVYAEEDPLGEATTPYSPTYSVSKIAQEGVARYCSRQFGLPIVIARMNAAYGPNGGLPLRHFARMQDGKPVTVKWAPLTYSPIHEDDIEHQLEALLDAASVRALTVNWCGDEPVSVEDWCREMSQETGIPYTVQVVPVAGSHRGLIADAARRRSLTGPCAIPWIQGVREAAKLVSGA